MAIPDPDLDVRRATPQRWNLGHHDGELSVCRALTGGTSGSSVYASRGLETIRSTAVPIAIEDPDRTIQVATGGGMPTGMNIAGKQW